MESLLLEESRLLSDLLEQQKTLSSRHNNMNIDMPKNKGQHDIAKANIVDNKKRWVKEFTYQDYKIVSALMRGDYQQTSQNTAQHQQILMNWFHRLSKGLDYLSTSQQIIVRLFRLVYLITAPISDDLEDYLDSYHESHHALNHHLNLFWRTVIHMHGFDIKRYRDYLNNLDDFITHHDTVDNSDNVKSTLHIFAHDLAKDYAQNHQDYIIVQRLLNRDNLLNIFWQQYYRHMDIQ